MNLYDVAVCPRVAGPHSQHRGRCTNCAIEIYWSAATEALGPDVPHMCVPCARRFGVERTPKVADDVTTDLCGFCGQQHASCEFGLGLACLKGKACTNPHHDPRPWPPDA